MQMVAHAGCMALCCPAPAPPKVWNKLTGRSIAEKPRNMESDYVYSASISTLALYSEFSPLAKPVLSLTRR
jgi:hypothetical protein